MIAIRRTTSPPNTKSRPKLHIITAATLTHIVGSTPGTGVTVATGVRVLDGVMGVASTVVADTVERIGTTLSELVCEKIEDEIAGVEGGTFEGVTTIVDEGVTIIEDEGVRVAAVKVSMPFVCTLIVAVVETVLLVSLVKEGRIG